MFDAPLEKASVQLDRTRVALMDVGARSLVIEPVVSPGEKESWVLRVRYADGASPEWAVLALVSRPGEVDLQLDVIRQRQTLEACQAELAQARARGESSLAEVWVLADRLRGSTVQSQQVHHDRARGWAYRFEDGLLLAVEVWMGDGQQPWTPTAAVLRSRIDPRQEARVHAVHVREGSLTAGKWGPVAVEAALPSLAAGNIFILELRDAGGRSLVIDGVQFPSASVDQGGGR